MEEYAVTQSISFVSGKRVLPWVVTSVLLAAAASAQSSDPFVLNGDLQTFTAIRNTTIATSTSPAPLEIGGDDISWNASSTVPWITLPVTSGTEAGPLAFSVDPAALPVGTSEGKILVTDENSGVTLEATVSVAARNLVFAVSPSALVFDVNATTTGSEQQFFTISDELNGQSGSAGYEWDVISPSTQIVVSPVEGNTATTTSVGVSLGSGLLNAVVGNPTLSPLRVLAQSPGPNGASAQAAVALSAQVRLPRANAVFPNIVEPGPVQVTLVGKDFQDEDLATLRVNGAAPVSVTRASDRVMNVDLGVVAAGQYVFTFDNPLGLTRSVAELTVTPRAPAAGPGQIVSNRARQNLRFDSHRGVLYATNIEAGAIQRFSYDGANWQELPAIAFGLVTSMDFASNARFMYAAGGQSLRAVDISQPTPVVTNLIRSSGNCGSFPSAALTAVAASPIGTVHGYPPMTCRLNPSGVTIDAFGHDLLLGDEVLPPRDAVLNEDANLFWNQSRAIVSGDRRYVVTPTSLWDSHTGQFLYSLAPNNRLPVSVDRHATKVLLGNTVVDSTGNALCTVPIDPLPFPFATVLSADGSRAYLYQPAISADIRVFSTAQSGTPSAPGVCATAAASIAVPNVGDTRPNVSIYGNQAVYAMTVSDDDNLLFLSGSSRILAIDVP
jgi:hypothetical protein